MHPLLRIDLANWRYDLAAYSLFLALAALVTVSVGMAVTVRRGTHPEKAALCISAIAVSAAAGGRLLDVATKARLYEADPSGAFRVDFSGFSLYGGLLLALPAAVLLCRALSIDPAHMADSLAPGVGSGIAIAKVGCFLAGCCHGTPAVLPWSVTFPIGSEPHLYQLFTGSVPIGRSPLPVHPTQLYEAVAAIVGTIAATWLLRLNLPRGVVFLGFAFWFTAFRLLDEQFRAPSLAFTAPSWFYPVLYSTIVLISGRLLVRRLLTSPWGSAVGGVVLKPADLSNSAGTRTTPATSVAGESQAARRSST